MKKLNNYFLAILAVFLLSSCDAISNEAENRLNELTNKANSLDSLVNKEFDKVLALDSLVNMESNKVKRLDSLIDKTSSKLDSITMEKRKDLERINK